MAKGKFDPNAITEIILRATGGEVGAASALAPKVYVIFNPHSYSHLFYKINIHASKYSSPLYLVIHIQVHKLTQAIMHIYVTLEPQADSFTRFRR